MPKGLLLPPLAGRTLLLRRASLQSDLIALQGLNNFATLLVCLRLIGWLFINLNLHLGVVAFFFATTTSVLYIYISLY